MRASQLVISENTVTFLEASEAFADDFSSEVADPDHSEGEYRYLLFGKTYGDKYVVVSYTERRND